MNEKLDPIAVSIVDDNPGMRQSLAQILEKVPDMSCVSTHGSAADAIAHIPRYRPRVVLMDINMRGMSGIDAVARLKPTLPQCDFVMLTVHEDPDLIFRSLRAGATGYLLKTAPMSEIVAGVRDITQGGAAVSAVVAMRLIRHFNEQPKSTPEVEKLSAREYEIVDYLAKGLGNKQIADRMDLSAGTVRNYLRNVYRKLHVNTRTEAVMRFLGREIDPSKDTV
jgi:DNA-binding NarL/FixJ family response regulator